MPFNSRSNNISILNDSSELQAGQASVSAALGYNYQISPTKTKDGLKSSELSHELLGSMLALEKSERGNPGDGRGLDVSKPAQSASPDGLEGLPQRKKARKSKKKDKNDWNTVYKRWTVKMTNEFCRLLIKHKRQRIDNTNSFTNIGFREIQLELKQLFPDQFDMKKFETKKLREKLKQINNEILGFKKLMLTEQMLMWSIAEGKLYLDSVPKVDELKKKSSVGCYPGLSWNGLRRYIAGGCHYIYIHSVEFYIDKGVDNIKAGEIFLNLSLGKALRPASIEHIMELIAEASADEDGNMHDGDEINIDNVAIYSSMDAVKAVDPGNRNSGSSGTSTSSSKLFDNFDQFLPMNYPTHGTPGLRSPLIPSTVMANHLNTLPPVQHLRLQPPQLQPQPQQKSLPQQNPQPQQPQQPRQPLQLPPHQLPPQQLLQLLLQQKLQHQQLQQKSELEQLQHHKIQQLQHLLQPPASQQSLQNSPHPSLLHTPIATSLHSPHPLRPLTSAASLANAIETSKTLNSNSDAKPSPYANVPNTSLSPKPSQQPPINTASQEVHGQNGAMYDGYRNSFTRFRNSIQRNSSVSSARRSLGLADMMNFNPGNFFLTNNDYLSQFSGGSFLGGHPSLGFPGIVGGPPAGAPAPHQTGQPTGPGHNEDLQAGQIGAAGDNKSPTGMAPQNGFGGPMDIPYNAAPVNNIALVLITRRKQIEDSNNFLRKLRGLGIISSVQFVEIGGIAATNDSFLFYLLSEDVTLEEKINFIKEFINQAS